MPLGMQRAGNELPAIFGECCQAQCQRLELLGAELQCWRHRSRLGCAPHEAARMHPPRGTPHAEAVVHEQLESAGPRIGEEVTMVRVGLAKRVDHHRQQPVGTSAHVLGLAA